MMSPNDNPFAKLMSGFDPAQLMQQMSQAWGMSLPTPPVSTALPNSKEAGWSWFTQIPPDAWLALAQAHQARLMGAWQALQTEQSEPAQDKRFAHEAFQKQPYFRWLKTQHELLNQHLTEAVAAAKLDNKEAVRAKFFVKQFIDSVAPTNSLLGNPGALEAAFESKGESLKKGFDNLQADIAKKRIAMTDESAFTVGINVAVTEGAVVYRNPLIELIQYTPTTKKVFAKPLLIVPPCINKFYILDMQPENSFVRHAVEQGHTVFIISWRNIPEELGGLGWEDYLSAGVLQAIEACKTISKQTQINTLGFCVGGTILSCSLAVLAARGDDSVASATSLTTLLDFQEPGEIGAYLSETSLGAREQALLGGQRLPGSELAEAFASLRANDLVWSFVINNYLHGKSPRAFDLLYWNSDSTNLPGPMYVYYLKQFYFANQLCKPNALNMLGEDIDLASITCPKFVVATREDHIVPWRSAFSSAQLFADDELTFVLGGSGHIAGIVNPPAKKQRGYHTVDFTIAPEADDWEAQATAHEGSWWTPWYAWLAPLSGKQVAARAVGNHPDYPALGAAPGTYVLEKA
jgi:polyhydroxyalkanoate synthase subunit PhaC